ncbi:hypothetical protein FNW02_02465 [Komarekiella sp. 'clone 1']|uniref:Uncharacterized protein n=1 Tax=Komarekiella delphini-convector SJRDD-AB1 TaxID=2593771 RepID=A0AA40STL0_9NOST|nr:hypothetical protein [Komarekiella delphini-convector]MBD6614752.1 hypothetical protein [Komarekiella delphini-convector SJRDD-AB1]
MPILDFRFWILDFFGSCPVTERECVYPWEKFARREINATYLVVGKPSGGSSSSLQLLKLWAEQILLESIQNPQAFNPKS